jgi:predicted ArsR family transcriptional regulator
MRAVAHPVRIALLEALAREGPLTATKAAELLDDSPGNMSWHLQTLAKYGFVEEAGGGRGRSRPWRVISRVNNFDSAGGDPEQAAAGDALEATYQERNFERLREWWAQRRSYPVQWRKAAFSNSSTTYLTAEELERLSGEVEALVLRYRDRVLDRSSRPEGALPVRVVAFAHPLPVTPGGN